MNPFPPYQFTQPRDKTKSYLQPTSHNAFSTSQVHSQSSTLSQHTSSSAYQSDKYKSYYTDFQDYRAPQSAFNVTSNSNLPLQRQKSYERNRFYTVTQNDRKDSASKDYPLANLQQDNFSQSMVVMTNRPTSINKEEANSKKDVYKFAASKFSSSRVESQYNSREKKTESHSNNKTDYLEKANKKVSLKRDIAPISPKYQQQTSNTNSALKYPPHQPSFINISNRFNINQNSNGGNNTKNKAQQNPSMPHHQNSMPFLPSANDSSCVLTQNSSEIQQKQTLQNSQKSFNEEMILPSTFERFSNSSQNSDLSINRKNSQKQVNQLSFKKNSNKGQVSTYEAQRAISAYDPQRTTPSSQSSSVATNQFASQVSNKTDDKSMNQNIGKIMNTKPFFGIIRSNSSKQRQPSTQQLIDSQVLTDMKISRIEQSTNNLEEKLLTFTKTLQQLIHQSKQQQTCINQINSYITKQEEQGLTPHDIKRIKKQLKIMKTNFETAFTSMTDQINRKLIKEESIMRSLSDQINLVAEENQKLNETIEKRSRKVDSLEKSMTSFMRQNEQRMQNLVLNESFSSSKRSKNHSFEYGLDLKNMSSEDNYSSAKNYNLDGNTSKKLQSIQKQITKMKIFHIKQQENHQGLFAQLKTDIEKATNEQQKYVFRTDAQHMIRQAVHEILHLKLQNWQVIQQQQQKQLQQRINQQLHAIKQKIEDLNKICHQELYDYRMNKLQQVSLAPNFVTQSKIKTMNSEFQQQLSQVQKKQRLMLITLTDFQQKLISFEDRQHFLHKNFDELKVKQLKHTGDVRQVQSSLKQVNHMLHSLNGFKESSLKTLNELSQSMGSQKGLINNLQVTTNNFEARINEVDRINAIQTENIESINNQFERVINKEIIPKIQEVHLGNIDINHRIHSLTTDVAFVKKLNESQGIFSSTLGQISSINSAKKSLTDDSQLQKKIEQFLTQNMSKFINSKVKLISTKLLSSKSPLSKIGLFKDKKPTSHMNSNWDNESEITKEETYLIDEDGYLMDWQGTYLVEVDEFGNRKKIRVSEEQLYFMQINGLEIKRPQAVIN